MLHGGSDLKQWLKDTAATTVRDLSRAETAMNLEDDEDEDDLSDDLDNDDVSEEDLSGEE